MMANDGWPEAELVLDAQARLGEGPVWDDRAGILAWIDILAPAVHLYRPADGSDLVVPVPRPVGAIALRESEGLLLALEDGFWVREADGSLRLLAAVEAGDPSTRMNDGGVDPAGRFYCGTMAYDERPGAASLYRLEPDGRVEAALSGATISNGIDWSPDERTCWYIDTPTRGVDLFDYDRETGALGNRRRAITVPDGQGWPDGLTVDAAGGVWVAFWGGGCVRRYLPDGSLDRVVRVPVAQVTSCAFGGELLDELYITTAWNALADADRRAQPLAGGLFRTRPGIRGLPARRFRG
jgi:sugar lactone lactonase YvrE